MSTIGISSALGNLSQAAQASSISKPTPEVSSATPTGSTSTLKLDVVKPSMPGQAKLLHQQGKSPALIASSLGLKVADVDGYLGIKVAAPVAATPAPSTKCDSTFQHPAEASAEAPEVAASSSPAPQVVAIETLTTKS